MTPAPGSACTVCPLCGWYYEHQRHDEVMADFVLYGLLDRFTPAQLVEMVMCGIAGVVEVAIRDHLACDHELHTAEAAGAAFEREWQRENTARNYCGVLELTYEEWQHQQALAPFRTREPAP